MEPIRKKWFIIQRIKDYRDTSADHNDVKYPNDFDRISIAQQHELLKFFEKEKVIKINTSPLDKKGGLIIGNYSLKIFDNKFDIKIKKIEREYKLHSNRENIKQNKCKPEFNSERMTLRWGRLSCILSPDDTIYYLTKIIFNDKLGDLIDIEQVHKKMSAPADSDWYILSKTERQGFINKIRFSIRDLNKKIANNIGIYN